MPQPSPIRYAIPLAALLGIGCKRSPEPVKLSPPSHSASAQMAAGLIVPPEPPDSLRPPAPDSILFRMPDGTPVRQAHLDTVQELLSSIDQEGAYLPEDSIPDPEDPYFYTSESFSDSEGTGDVSPSRLACKHAIAEALLLSAVLSDSGRSLSRGGLAEDTLLTKWGCPPFRPGRRQYGLFPAGQGQAVWKPVKLRYDVDVKYFGPVEIPGKFRSEIRVRVTPFVGEGPEGPQPFLFASSARGMPGDPVIWREAAIPPERPAGPADSASLPVAMDVQLPGLSSPWHDRLWVRWKYRWEPGGESPHLDAEPLPGRIAGIAELHARPAKGGDRILAGFGEFDPEKMDGPGLDRVVLTDLEADGEPDHLLFYSDRGVVLQRGFEREWGDNGPAKTFLLVNPIDPGGC